MLRGYNNILTAQKIEDPIKKIIQNTIDASCTIYVNSGKQSWIGSGFHIFGAGYVATASHVVPPEIIHSGHEIILMFPGGSYYSADLVWSEHTYDCAILYSKDIVGKIKSVELANSDTVETGDIVAVISSPEGMSATATVGRVTNIGQGMGEHTESEAWRDDLIIIDADILEGSSGGMCILTDGKVAGSVMGEFGQNVAYYGRGHRAICPSNKIAEIYHKSVK